MTDLFPYTHPGPIGFISAEVIKKYIAPPSLGEKVKVFVCGEYFHMRGIG
jgi:hypothetical protein